MANEYRHSFIGVEAFHIGAPAGRVSSNAVEVYHPGTPFARLSHVSAEVFYSYDDTAARLSEMAIEVFISTHNYIASFIGVEAFHTGDALARVSEMAAEVFHPADDVTDAYVSEVAVEVFIFIGTPPTPSADEENLCILWA